MGRNLHWSIILAALFNGAGFPRAMAGRLTSRLSLPRRSPTRWCGLGCSVIGFGDALPWRYGLAVAIRLSSPQAFSVAENNSTMVAAAIVSRIS
jgi:hypothetical protein